MFGPLIIGCIVAAIAAAFALFNGSSFQTAVSVYSVTGIVTVLSIALIVYIWPKIREILGL